MPPGDLIPACRVPGGVTPEPPPFPAFCCLPALPFANDTSVAILAQTIRRTADAGTNSRTLCVSASHVRSNGRKATSPRTRAHCRGSFKWLSCGSAPARGGLSPARDRGSFKWLSCGTVAAPSRATLPGPVQPPGCGSAPARGGLSPARESRRCDDGDRLYAKEKGNQSHEATHHAVGHQENM